MDYHGALGVLRTIVKERPDAILVNEGANALDLTRGVIDMYQPRKRLDVGTWGRQRASAWGCAPLGLRSRPASRVLAIEGDSALASPAWRWRRSAATSCRSASSSSTMTASIVEPTSIAAAVRIRRPPSSSKGSRYDKMMEAFGGVGVNATSPDELKRAVNEAMGSGKPTLINAVLDPAAGSESGRIGESAIRKALKKK